VRCPSCGIDNLDGVRQCGGCGLLFGLELLGPARAPRPTETRPIHARARSTRRSVRGSRRIGWHLSLWIAILVGGAAIGLRFVPRSGIAGGGTAAAAKAIVRPPREELPARNRATKPAASVPVAPPLSEEALYAFADELGLLIEDDRRQELADRIDDSAAFAVELDGTALHHHIAEGKEGILLHWIGGNSMAEAEEIAVDESGEVARVEVDPGGDRGTIVRKMRSSVKIADLVLPAERSSALDDESAADQSFTVNSACAYIETIRVRKDSPAPKVISVRLVGSCRQGV
jgi:hypothetical protein